MHVAKNRLVPHRQSSCCQKCLKTTEQQKLQQELALSSQHRKLESETKRGATQSSTSQRFAKLKAPETMSDIPKEADHLPRKSRSLLIDATHRCVLCRRPKSNRDVLLRGRGSLCLHRISCWRHGPRHEWVRSFFLILHQVHSNSCSFR